MKNLKLIALALAISVSSVSFAMPTNEDPKSELRDQIVEMLGKTTDRLANTNVEAEIVFTVNSRSEIVIISVNAKKSSAKIEGFVKNRLNNKKINSNSIVKEKIYHLPLTIVNK